MDNIDVLTGPFTVTQLCVAAWLARADRATFAEVVLDMQLIVPAMIRRGNLVMRADGRLELAPHARETVGAMLRAGAAAARR